MTGDSRPGKTVGVIAQPDTGMMMTISYRLGPAADGGGGTIAITIGRIGHDEPDAEMELQATHTGTLWESLHRATEALMQNRDG